MNIAWPFRYDGRGRSAQSATEDHVREMIEQMLFTNAGERVNRPDFGSGLQQMVFAANGPEIAAALQYTMQAALQRWLGDVIQIKALDVSADDSVMRIVIQYTIRASGQLVNAQFSRSV